VAGEVKLLNMLIPAFVFLMGIAVGSSVQTDNVMSAVLFGIVGVIALAVQIWFNLWADAELGKRGYE
jgi:protein-S-isoprenylcysteine O-methyltransferase Ste14